jgi:hypothetical protein
MSHVEAYTELRFVDLDVLERAAAAIGCELVRNQTTYQWYGRYLRDSLHLPHAAEKAGLIPDGTCQHVLRVKDYPGAYEVGLVPHPDGQGGWIPLFDSWGAAGRTLVQAIGSQCEKLGTAYGQQAVLQAAQENHLQWNISHETDEEVVYTLVAPWQGY